MSLRNASSGADANTPPHGGSSKVADSSYECMLCGGHWAYGDIHNTARCPACGGGLIRDVADPVGG